MTFCRKDVGLNKHTNYSSRVEVTVEVVGVTFGTRRCQDTTKRILHGWDRTGVGGVGVEETG